MWIAGADLPGDGSPEVVRNPATEEPLAEVASASPGQVDRAVAAARAALGGWRRTPAGERGELPHGVAAWLRDHTQELGRLMTLEELDACTCGSTTRQDDAGPFGGMKMSGDARELGPEGLEAFRETRHVHLDGRAEPKPWWYLHGQAG
jgi:acyl-CoA reductase-like NAD-dependent aldehyde dehydrogenase